MTYAELIKQQNWEPRAPTLEIFKIDMAAYTEDCCEQCGMPLVFKPAFNVRTGQYRAFVRCRNKHEIEV